MGNIHAPLSIMPAIKAYQLSSQKGEYNYKREAIVLQYRIQVEIRKSIIERKAKCFIDVQKEGYSDLAIKDAISILINIGYIIVLHDGILAVGWNTFGLDKIIEEESCAICFEKVYTTDCQKCGHMIHDNCVHNWVQGNPKRGCPMCIN